MDLSMKLSELGERRVVAEITRLLPTPDLLLDGIGHDAAFVDMLPDNDDVLVINTDRSGTNVAYQLGLAGAECIGDFGISHAVSDVVVAGGVPRAVTVALLLPGDSTLGFVHDVMKGAATAAERYGAVIVAGDTKQNPKFAMVVTVVGTVHRKKRIARSGAHPGDVLVVTGFLGSMFLGLNAFRSSLFLSEKVRRILEIALIEQRPPFVLGRAIADAGIPCAGTDISDGLPGAIHAVCKASGVGALIDETRIPLDPDLADVVTTLALPPLQLASAGGDWQFLYAVPKERVVEMERIAARVGGRITVIGKFVSEGCLARRDKDGNWQQLDRIEHDSFADGAKGRGHFEEMTDSTKGFGKMLNQAECQALWDLDKHSAQKFVL